MRAVENDDLGVMVMVMGGGGKERGDKSEIVDELNERVPERPSLGARNHVTRGASRRAGKLMASDISNTGGSPIDPCATARRPIPHLSVI